MHVCMCTHMHIHTCPYMHTYVHTHTHMHAHVDMHTWAHTCICTHAHMGIHMYTHMHTLIHTFKTCWDVTTALGVFCKVVLVYFPSLLSSPALPLGSGQLPCPCGRKKLHMRQNQSTDQSISQSLQRDGSVVKCPDCSSREASLDSSPTLYIPIHRHMHAHNKNV